MATEEQISTEEQKPEDQGDPSSATDEPQTNVTVGFVKPDLPDTGRMHIDADAPSRGGAGSVDTKIGRAGLAGDAAVKALNGDIKGAAASVVISASLEFAAKKIPGAAPFVTAGLGAVRVGELVQEGQYIKAATETVASVGETLGNVALAGDAIREGIRYAAVAVVGEENAPDKSGARQLAENTYKIGEMAVDYATRDDSPTEESVQVAAAAPQKSAPVQTASAASTVDGLVTNASSLDRCGISGEFSRAASGQAPAAPEPIQVATADMNVKPTIQQQNGFSMG